MEYDFDPIKNTKLIIERNICFEDAIIAIEGKQLIKILQHPKKDLYPQQKMALVLINEYIWCVPFVEKDGVRFLKTMYPDRKYQREYKRRSL